MSIAPGTNVLAGADATWVESIALDATAHDATVTLNVPLGDTAGMASYEEVIDFDEPNVPAYVRDATRAFVEAAVRYVRERDAAKLPEGVEVRCVTCTSPCCARVFSEVAVSAEDAARLGEADVRRGVALYPHGQTWTGYVGVIKRTSWQGEGTASWDGDDRPMACVFVDRKTSLCTVYDRRPLICQNYTAHDCAEHESASPRLITLRRRAMTGAP